MTDSENDNPTAQRLMADVPVMPAATPPSIESLNQRVTTVRRRRRIVRSVSATTVALLFVFVARSGWLQQAAPLTDPAHLIAEANSAAAHFEPDPNGIDPDGIGDVAQPASSEQLRSQPPKVQLYASLSQSVPVFDFDGQTKTLHHIGWVESQQEVPVDMKYVPDNQQNSFKAVLHEDDVWHFSL